MGLINFLQTINKMEERNIIVCSNGNMFMSTPTLSTNTWTFIYMNKNNLTTFDVYKKTQKKYEQYLKRVQSSHNITALADLIK
jgi:exosome complex RNA-binding protein Rrp4